MSAAPSVLPNQAEASDLSVCRKFYSAREVSTILAIPLPSLYQLARNDPSRLGAIKLGRTLRFRQSVIERLVNGEAGAAEAGAK